MDLSRCLQAYRTLLLSSQALLLALGAGLFVADLAMNSAVQVYAVSALMVAIAIGAVGYTVAVAIAGIP